MWLCCKIVVLMSMPTSVHCVPLVKSAHAILTFAVILRQLLQRLSTFSFYRFLDLLTSGSNAALKRLRAHV